MVTEKDHLKKIKCKILDVEGFATIYVENNIFFLIQNFKDGSEPENSNWKNYGRFSWKFIPSNLSRDRVEILNTERIYELW